MALGSIVGTIFSIALILLASLVVIMVGGWCIKMVTRIISGCAKTVRRGFFR